VLSFDPKRSFFSLWVVWISFGFLCAIASIVSFVIYSNEALIYQPDAAGFATLVKVFQVPLGILALTIPVIALLASNHRSVQTREQIVVAAKESLFTNYYKHAEEFTRYLQEHVREVELVDSNPMSMLIDGGESTMVEATVFDVSRQRMLHKSLFPDAYSGSFEASPLMLDKASLLFERLFETMGEYALNGDFERLSKTTRRMFTYLDHEFYMEWGNYYAVIQDADEDGGLIHTQFDDEKHFINVLVKRASKVREIFEFDPNCSFPQSLLDACGRSTVRLQLMGDKEIRGSQPPSTFDI